MTSASLSQRESMNDPLARVRHLSEVGSAVEVDVNIPPRRYFRSGMEMLRMATVYMEEGNLENAFILYSKFITLFVEKLPQHPEYKTAQPADKANVKKKLKEVFPRAESLKNSLKEKYGKEHEKWLLEKKLEEERLRKEEERQRREEDERRKVEIERRKLDEQNREKIQAELEKLKLLDIDSSRGNLDGLNFNAEMLDYPNLSTVNTGPEYTLADKALNAPSAPIPNIPSREVKPTSTIASIPDVAVNTMPSIDRTTKPSSVMSPGSASETGLHNLRNIIVPTILMAKFLALAQKNTNCNVETCGILTGKLCQNSFTITHLVVPKQSGTPDSCSTENEEEIFEVQDQHDLITLGWIHTHPSQTSFMSSVDLHTHCAYQLMLPEAIAIVCSPKFDETGVFSLTHDYGLNYVAKCRLPGFHPHPKEPPLYSESQNVHFDSNANVSIIDLR